MAFTLVSEALWSEIEELFPKERRSPKGGRPRVSNRACFTGIVYVLRTGMPWRFVPRELGCGSGVTCWRRLRAWTRAGVWPKVHRKLLEAMARKGQVDASLAVMDSASIRALFGGPTPGRTPRIGRKRVAKGTF